jgi:hypothetical protein
VFDADTLRPWLDTSLRSRLRLMLKGAEHAHLVYREDVSFAATHWLQAPPAKGQVETFIVSSDEDPGHTHLEVQRALAARIPAAPRPSPIPVPLFVPYAARRLRTPNTNRGDIIYSGRKLRDAGVTLPFGLRAGLERCISELT